VEGNDAVSVVLEMVLCEGCVGFLCLRAFLWPHKSICWDLGAPLQEVTTSRSSGLITKEKLFPP